MSIRVLISDDAVDSAHALNVRAAVLSGYGEGLSAEEIEITTLTGQDLFDYSGVLGSVQAIVRSMGGIEDYQSLADVHPELFVCMPLGSNDSVELLTPAHMGSVIACGGGATENETGWGHGIEFWDNGINGNNVSSYATGRIAGKILKILDSGDNAGMPRINRYRAKLTASNGGVWDEHNGYGQINVGAASAQTLWNAYFPSSHEVVGIDLISTGVPITVGTTAVVMTIGEASYTGVLAAITSSVSYVLGDVYPELLEPITDIGYTATNDYTPPREDPQYFTALTRILTNVSDITFEDANIGDVIQFYDDDDNPYYSPMLAFINPSSIILEKIDSLPIMDIIVFDVQIVDAVPADENAYCTIDDLQVRIGTQYLAQITNDEANGTLPDAAVVNEMIKIAAVEIDNILSGTYTTPITPVPPIIRKICTDIAIYHAMMRRFSIMEVPKQWIKAYTKAIDDLDKIASMENALPNTNVVTSHEAEIVSKPVRFAFDDPNSPMSKY